MWLQVGLYNSVLYGRGLVGRIVRDDCVCVCVFTGLEVCFVCLYFGVEDKQVKGRKGTYVSVWGWGF